LVQIALPARAWFLATAYSRFGNPIAKEPAEGRFLVTEARNAAAQESVAPSSSTRLESMQEAGKVFPKAGEPLGIGRCIL
jgi:hypothetical protein